MQRSTTRFYVLVDCCFIEVLTTFITPYIMSGYNRRTKADIRRIKADIRRTKADIRRIKADIRRIKADIRRLDIAFTHRTILHHMSCARILCREIPVTKRTNQQRCVIIFGFVVRFFVTSYVVLESRRIIALLAFVEAITFAHSSTALHVLMFK